MEEAYKYFRNVSKYQTSLKHYTRHLAMQAEESFRLRSIICTGSLCLHVVIHSKYQQKR